MLRDLMEFLGLAILVSFTSVIIAISIVSRGALIYYYEPNKIIWIVEVLLGIGGVLVGLVRLKECLPGLSFRSNSGFVGLDAGGFTSRMHRAGSARARRWRAANFMRVEESSGNL